MIGPIIDFCTKNLFLELSPKLSTFRGKGRYFQMTAKTGFCRKGRYIVIFGKRTIYCDHFKKSFLELYPQLSTCRGERSFSKIRVWPYLLTINIFGKRVIFSDHFDHSSNLSTFWGTWWYLDITLRNSIFAQKTKLWTFRGKFHILRSLWKNWFLPKKSFFGLISKIINISGKWTIFKVYFLVQRSHILFL